MTELFHQSKNSPSKQLAIARGKKGVGSFPQAG
ncbi:hypothetical protein PgNI_06393 [Pyricularia grisea]|uniref:Uncharacterized protein n=1 Tax=Pyricularia grisea TaxID=148305 RepID=A0A6P8B5C2_PYRGI|nr:hypothetical protein PgNI_06393 [Pyricularia grisea]TLD10541.1 hypothetical protein PgNI_06393 [Pyricularia grisea]